MAKKTRKLKAWAVLNEKRQIVSIELGRSRPTRFYVGSWVFFIEDTKSEVVPCTITFDIKKARKKKKPLEGKRVRMIKGVYKGNDGVIEYCRRCCKAYRVEFDKIGNNTRLADLKGDYIFI